MNNRRSNQHHNALLLLACAFAFVYLLTRQFQGPVILEKIDPSVTKQTISTWKTTPLPQTLPQPSWETKKTTIPWSWWSNSGFVWFNTLDALPQSFVRLGLKNTQWVLIDAQKIIISTNTNSIKRDGESKTLTGWELRKIWLTADSLTFYNDPSRANVMVVMEVIHNQQSLLIQTPYIIYRDHKPYLNSIITQLTQK